MDIDVEKLEGRELDAIVAELMGWIWIRFKYELGGYEGPEHAFQVKADELGGFFDTDKYMADDGKYPKQTHARVPHYSTEIAAAFQVEEQIRKLKLVKEYCEALCEIVDTRNDIVLRYSLWSLIHATPEQRCKAALKAALAAEEKG